MGFFDWFRKPDPQPERTPDRPIGADEFALRLEAARSLLAWGDPLFGDESKASELPHRKWPRPLKTPMHRGFLLLSELYLEASPEQRQALRETVSGLDLSDFIRRVARLMTRSTGQHWLRIGLSAAGLDNGTSDYRDLITALSILVQTARQARVAVEPSLVEARQMSPGIARWLDGEYLATVLDH